MVASVFESKGTLLLFGSDTPTRPSHEHGASKTLPTPPPRSSYRLPPPNPCSPPAPYTPPSPAHGKGENEPPSACSPPSAWGKAWRGGAPTGRRPPSTASPPGWPWWRPKVTFGSAPVELSGRPGRERAGPRRQQSRCCGSGLSQLRSLHFFLPLKRCSLCALRLCLFARR